MPAACSSRRIPALCTLLLSSLVRTYRKAPATSGWWLPCSTCGFFFSCDSLGPKETLWPRHHHWPTWHWPAMRCLWTSAMKLQAPISSVAPDWSHHAGLTTEDCPTITTSPVHLTESIDIYGSKAVTTLSALCLPVHLWGSGTTLAAAGWHGVRILSIQDLRLWLQLHWQGCNSLASKKSLKKPTKA